MEAIEDLFEVVLPFRAARSLDALDEILRHLRVSGILGRHECLPDAWSDDSALTTKSAQRLRLSG